MPAWPATVVARAGSGARGLRCDGWSRSLRGGDGECPAVQPCSVEGRVQLLALYDGPRAQVGGARGGCQRLRSDLACQSVTMCRRFAGQLVRIIIKLRCAGCRRVRFLEQAQHNRFGVTIAANGGDMASGDVQGCKRAAFASAHVVRSHHRRPTPAIAGHRRPSRHRLPSQWQGWLAPGEDVVSSTVERPANPTGPDSAQWRERAFPTDRDGWGWTARASRPPEAEPVIRPASSHGVLGARALARLPCCPVWRVVRGSLLRTYRHFRAGGDRRRPWSTTPRRGVYAGCADGALAESAAPSSHRVRRRLPAVGGLIVGHAVSSQQSHQGFLRRSMGQRRLSSHHLSGPTVVRGHIVCGCSQDQGPPIRACRARSQMEQ